MKKLTRKKTTKASKPSSSDSRESREEPAAPEPRETREVCDLHGWVGRRAFRRDRHDLCEAVAEELPIGEGDLETEDEGDSAAESEETERPRWSRAGARKQGIPPKKTLAIRRITKVELAEGRVELRVLGADVPYDRPKTRGACQWCPVCQLVRDGKSDGNDEVAAKAIDVAVPPRRGRKRPDPEMLVCGHRVATVLWHSRPCIFVACKHNVYLDVSDTGSIVLNFPHLEPDQMPQDQSCSLDLAGGAGMTLEEIAVVTNLTRERIRQIELKSLIRRARPAAIALGLGADDAASVGVRRSVGPGADLVETGVDGEVPSDVATILTGGGGS